MRLPGSRFRQFARSCSGLFALGLVVACAPSEPPERAAATITEDSLLEHVLILGADEFEGRGPASAGDAKTQQYLVAQLEALGYQPAAADGGWLQPFDIVGVDPVVPETWSFTAGDTTREFARWDEFVATSGLQDEKAVIDNAEVVFVGYGIEAPEYDWDDFKGRDLRGKVLLIMNSDPEWDPDLFEGETRLYYGRWDYKYENAARQGAVGAIVIHTTPSAGYPWQVVQTSWTGEYFRLPLTDAPVLPVEGWLTEAAAAELVALAGKDLAALVESARSRDFEPVSLGITTSLTLDLDITKTQTANVLGVLPGSDPELADEYVVLTAHHDHLGIGVPDESGDDIYNGARDNALGVSTVLNIAGAYASLPEAPRRSIMIAMVGAEEQGLLGSLYFAQNPTVPPGRMAANMNYDGGNIWGRSPDLVYIGYGKSSLGAITEFVAARQGRSVVPDQYPDRGFYYRSDQFNFAKIGVPATYFGKPLRLVGRSDDWAQSSIGEYEAVRYHQPSDEYYDEWNLEGQVEDARLGFWIGLIVANDDDMPTWTPGDEFEAARLESIQRK